VVQQWLDSKTMMSAAGWARYRTHARHWTRFFVGQRGLLHFSGLTSDLVNYYTVARFAELRESGQPGGRPEKTVRDELTALRQCVYWALDHEPPLIGKDIMRKVVRPPVPRKKIPRAFTPAQQAALLSAASGDPRRSLMLHLSLYAGLRREGVAKLRVADVHLEEAAPWLRVEEKTRHTRCVSGEKDERDVPISPQLAESFRRCPAVEGSEHWFGDLTEGAIDREFGELCAFIQRTLGVKGYDGRFHNCRHAFVTDMVDNGVDLQVAAVLAGHSSTRTTEQYRSVRQPLLQAAIAKRAGVGTT
jgi:integrase